MSRKNAKRQAATYTENQRKNTPKNGYLEKLAQKRENETKPLEAAPEQAAQPVAESAAPAAQSAADAAERQELDAMRRQLEQKQQEITATQKEQDARQQQQDTREKDLNQREQLQAVVQASIDQQTKTLEQRVARLKQQQQELYSQQKQQAEDHIAAEKEIQQNKIAANKELTHFREGEMAKIQAEVSATREKQMKDAEQQANTYAQKRREAVETELAAERAAWNAQKAQERKKLDAELEEKRAAWTAEKEKEQKKLDARKKKLDEQEQELDDREDTLDEALNQKKQNLLQKLHDAEQKITNLEHDLTVSNARTGALEELQKRLQKYEAFEQTWGGSPEKLQRELDDLRTKNSDLKDEIATRPSPDIVRQCEEKDEKIKSLENRCTQLEERAARNEQDAAELLELRENKASLEDRVQQAELERNIAQKDNEELNHALERFLRPEVPQKDREERVQALMIPYLTDIPKQLGEEGQPKDEIEWLQGIESRCEEYGFVFPHRLLYAFHTALKIADWSSITILSGISGTGKSELPRLYARFGGINFCAVPVQPNWDSQESMLGYFNSIDNRFEATGLLRFLVQSTNWEQLKDEAGNMQYENGNPIMLDAWEKPWPLDRYMSIVLLDEMNLAHVEHYFAEFLSKLESRRGTKGDDVPPIDVNLGSGCEPYKLYLRRNVLWVGTMNQDETTKTLSDKVLDRSIMLHFPTPKKLESRRVMKELPDARSDHMLEYWTWNAWCKTAESDNREYQKRINEYRSVIERINEQMGRSGRAVGHRVWQSIEFYIANYPEVIVARKGETAETPLSPKLSEAMRVAFEDQLVQKIMPKLRGIEDSGSGKEQLDEIWTILENAGFGDLQEDFDRARRYGYGEFFWNSDEYMEQESQSVDPDAEAPAADAQE